jgi:transposase
MTDHPNPIVSIGLDVSKKDFHAALIASGQADPVRLGKRAFERSPAGAEALIEAIDASGATLELAGASLRIVMEATGAYSRQLAEWLLARRPGTNVAVVNPAFIKAYGKSLGARNKTDSADARLIARYGLEREPVWFSPLPETLKRLRALSRERDAVVRQVVETKNRSQETTDAPKEVRKVQRVLLAALEKQRDALEASMLETIRRDDQWRQVFQWLVTIPGVGKITAMVVLAEIGDLRRFDRSRQLSAFAGTNPQIVESGTSVRHSSRLCKMGTPRVRQALFLSAMAAVKKGDNDLARVYRRLVERGKAKMVALCAVMRKQLLVMRALMIHETEYHEGRLCA